MNTALQSSETQLSRAAARFRTARLLAAATALWMAPHAMGQLTVTNLDDAGAGSLRDVLAGAAAGSTIDFDSGLSGAVNLNSQITINQGVTINGPGITINGGGATRLFFVNAGSGQAVELNGLTLTNGNAQGGNGGNGGEGGGGGGLGAGGAVFAQSGNVTLADINLTNNAATGGSGGTPGTFTGGGGGGGGLGGNGGNGLSDDVSGGGGGGGITQNGLNGQSNDDGGAGGGDEGGNGANASTSSSAGNGQFGGGGGGGGGGFDGPGFSLSNPNFPGADGGFGGGGGGGASDDFAGADGGDGGLGGGGGGGGFGDGAEASPTDGTTEGGSGGLGGGNGGSGGRTDGDGSPGSGGGGAGLGGAVFVAEGASLTLSSSQNLNQSDNTATGGTGGAAVTFSFGGATPGGPGGGGQAGGDFLFAQGVTQNITVNVAQGVTQSLDLSGIADETVLTDSAGAAGTGVANLIKTGAGALALNGNASFAGSITVNGGSLASGSGSVGSVTLNNDLNISTGGALNVEFDSSSIDQFVVNGTANLGGTVNFIELASGLATNTPLTFLTADTINGSFATTNTVFLNGSSLSSADVSFTNNGTSDLAQVTFGAFTATFATQGLTRGGGGAGAALDALAVSDPGVSVAIINAVNASPNPAAALESQGNIVGNTSAVEVNTAFAQVTHTARTRISNNALSQATASSSQLASAHHDTLVDDTTVDPAAFTLPQSTHDGPVGWAQLIGGFSTIDGDSLGLGSDAATYGVTLGIEWGGHALGEADLFGVFLGYTQTRSEVDVTSDESEADNIQVGAYLSRDLDEQLHFNAIGSVSYINFETERLTTLGLAEGDFDGVGFQGSLELLYDLNREEQTMISPYVGVEGSLVLRDDYTESGAGALNLSVDDETDEYITTLLGVQASGQFDFEDGPGRGVRVIAGARAAWGYQLLDTNASTTSAFTVASANRFTTSGPERDRSSFRGGLNLELIPLDNKDWNLFAQYTVDFNADAQDHILQAGVRFAF